MQTKVISQRTYLVLMVIMAGLAYCICLQSKTLSNHAVERHGTAAIKAAECIERPDKQVFFNSKTNRVGHACQMNGRWAVAITENDRIVTAFFKEKLKRIGQVIRYMKNAGYSQ